MSLQQVWILTTDGTKPHGDFTIVSTMHMGSSVQYRLVGDLASQNGAVSTEPGLEDSYVLLMREKRAPGLFLTS